MNILIVSQYYYPDQFLINTIAPAMVKAGNQVTVLTGLPNYPSGNVPSEYRFLKKCKEYINGVYVIRCPIIARGNLLKLILNAFSFAISASCVAFFLKGFDVIYAYQLTPITQVIPAVINKKIYKKKLFLYCCDLAPASGKKLQNKGVISKIYKWLCRKIYTQCDRIGVTSESFIDYLEAINHYPREKIIYLPQHANDDMLKMDMSVPDNGIVDFLFAGNISPTQGLDTIVNAVAILRDCRNTNDFLVHIVG
ncbi:MAG: glycosyltransferase family 4 protein, partial [Clostridiaceae bacterium]|nr:glycosyltransferase family 4 protein [Clostridiaceae bacterium]